MTKYGYVSGRLKDEVSKQDGFQYQAKILLNMGIPYENCFADVFRHKNKERYQLFKFLTTIAQEGDILVVPTLTCLYSNVRELCCLMYWWRTQVLSSNQKTWILVMIVIVATGSLHHSLHTLTIYIICARSALLRQLRRLSINQC